MKRANKIKAIRATRKKLSAQPAAAPAAGVETAAPAPATEASPGVVVAAPQSEPSPAEEPAPEPSA